LAEPKTFEVVALNNTTLPATDRAAMVAFQKEVSELSKAMNGTMTLVNEMKEEVVAMEQTALTLPNAHSSILPALSELKKELNDIQFVFNGLKAKASWEEIPPAQMPLYKRLNSIIWAQINSTSDITSTSRRSFEILKEKFPPELAKVKTIAEQKLPELRKQMDALNAPYTKGRIPQWK